MSFRMLICCIILPVFLRCSKPSGNHGKALEVLKKVAACDDFWVQIHAVEYLAIAGYQKEATALIAEHLRGNDTVPQKRIGVWRASYLSCVSEADAMRFLNKIVRAYVDTTGSDRVHAAETLAKLGYSLKGISSHLLKADSTAGGMLAAFVNWGKAIPNSNESLPDYDGLLHDLKNDDAEMRKLAAFGLGYLANPLPRPTSAVSQQQPAIPADKWQTLYKLALQEDTTSVAYPYLLSTAYSLYDFKLNLFEPEFVILHSRLKMLEYRQNKSARIELCRALAVHSLPGDEQVLERLMTLKQPITDPGLPGIEKIGIDHPWNQDVQAAAAYALLSQ
jgi:solute:Na+ symporter, SSS family